MIMWSGPRVACTHGHYYCRECRVTDGHPDHPAPGILDSTRGERYQAGTFRIDYREAPSQRLLRTVLNPSQTWWTLAWWGSLIFVGTLIGWWFAGVLE